MKEPIVLKMPFEIVSMCYNYETQKLNDFYGSYGAWVEYFTKNLPGNLRAHSKKDRDQILSFVLNCKCGGRKYAKAVKMRQSKKVKEYFITTGRDVMFEISSTRQCSIKCTGELDLFFA
jgi:hypothetical protein